MPKKLTSGQKAMKTIKTASARKAKMKKIAMKVIKRKR